MRTAVSRYKADRVSSTKNGSNPVLTFSKLGASCKAAKQRRKAADIQISGATVRKTAHGPPVVGGNVAQCFRKFKLQLFPVDDFTRRRLEECNYNPYLELTLGMKKKISSVVKHLITKWGNLKAASGELMLLPYDANIESSNSCKRWTSKDSGVTAADVYDAVSNPAIFRLRYGWFSNFRQETCGVPRVSSLSQIGSQNKDIEKPSVSDGKQNFDFRNQAPLPIEAPDTSVLIEEKHNRITDAGASLVLADGLSNMSFSTLLGETSLPIYTSSLQQLASTCDSFDAAIAAHIAQYQSMYPNASTQVPPKQSIWDAEQTCDGFPFRKITPCKDFMSSSTQNDFPQSMRIPEVGFEAAQVKDSALENTTDVHHVSHSNKAREGASTGLPAPSEASVNGISDLAKIDFSMSESMGAWLNGLSSSRPMLGGDNISLSSFVAGSLDASQKSSS